MNDVIAKAIEASRDTERALRTERAGEDPIDSQIAGMTLSDMAAEFRFREALAVAAELLSSGCEIGPRKRSDAITRIAAIVAGERS